MRKISDEEIFALRLLSGHLPEGQKSQLLEDMSRSRVIDVTKDGSRRIFIIDGYLRSEYIGQHPYPVEGGVKDLDGADMSVCVYADQNDRLLELEIIRWGEGDVICPQWNTFEIKY